MRVGLWSSGLVLCIACGGSDDPSGSDGSTSEASSSSTSPSTMPPGVSSGADTTGSAGASSGSSDGGPTTSSTTGTPGTTSSTTTAGATDSGTDSGDSGSGTGNPGGAVNGSPCEDNADCISGECYVVPLLGGICSECNSETDCPAGGCSVPNPLANLPAVCNDGSLGGGCETDVSCNAPLTCEVIIATPVITASTCSECNVDGDCGGDLCVPSYDVLNISGFNSCEPAGSVANGEGCDLGATGDASCTSGVCATASFMGFADLGICSECETDMDCQGNMTCMPAEISLALGLVAGTCV